MKLRTMNKEFEYRGERFNIKVELFTLVRLQGSRCHRIAVDNMGKNKYHNARFLNSDLFGANELEEAIKTEIEQTQKYVDERLDKPAKSELELKLEELGFK